MSEAYEYHTAKDIYLAGGTVYTCGFKTIKLGGETRRIAEYWVNGKQYLLTTEEDNAEARAIAVSNGGVYVAGVKNDKPVYWKNGNLKLLTDTFRTGNTTDISIKNGNVYICGNIFVNGVNSLATYWINGKEEYLGLSAYVSRASSLYLTDEDVYITGFVYGSNGGTTLYWKN